MPSLASPALVDILSNPIEVRLTMLPRWGGVMSITKIVCSNSPGRRIAVAFYIVIVNVNVFVFES